MAKKYRLPKGSKPAAKVTFTDPETTTAPIDEVTGKTLVDPTTVLAEVRPPVGSSTPYTYGASPYLTRDSQGKYRLVFELAMVGSYYVKWTGETNTKRIVEYTLIDSYVEDNF